jgi:hypothetical protein
MRLIYIHRIFKKCGGSLGGREKKSMKMPPIPDESWISHSVFSSSFPLHIILGSFFVIPGDE